MQEELNKNLISIKLKEYNHQEEHQNLERKLKSKVSSDSLKDKINSNLDNSDSFQIFNPFQEDDFNLNIQEQLKLNKNHSNYENLQKYENKIPYINTNQKEDDLEKFYEQQQMEMEKALNKKNSSQNNNRTKSKEKTKLKKSSNNNAEINIINKNFNNSTNNINLNPTSSYINNNNLRNLKNLNTNSSLNFKDLTPMNLNTSKNETNNIINNKHIRNNSAVVKRNLIASYNSNGKNNNMKKSFVKNSPQKINKQYTNDNVNNLNRSYCKASSKNAEPKTDKYSINKKKILNNSNNEFINNTKSPKKVTVNVSSTKVNNSVIINNNKITYEAYNSNAPNKIPQRSVSANKQNENLKKSESTNNLRSDRKISREINKDEFSKKNENLRSSGYKDLTNNKNNVHNIIKLKISNNNIEEVKNFKDKSNSKEKKITGNYKSFFEKKREFDKNYIIKANNTVNNNNIINNSSALNKNSNFLTIQEQENYNNKIQVENTFRKNTSNLKINTNNNLNRIPNENLNLNKSTKNNINSGINSVKTGIAPIKLLGEVANQKPLNNKNENFEPDCNSTLIIQKNFNTDLNNYLKNEQEKNSYTYLLNKNRNTPNKLANKKINSSQNPRESESLKKLNNTVDAVVSIGKYNKSNLLKNKNILQENDSGNTKKTNASINNSKVFNNNRDQILIEKILKENNIGIAKVSESDDKRCLTSNEKLSEFFSLNLNFDAILNNNKEINLLLNEKDQMYDSEFNNLKNVDNINFENEIKNNFNNKDNKSNENSNYLINSNISNNFKISHNSYMKNINIAKANDNKDFIKDNSLANFLFSNENNNDLKENNY